MLKGYPSRFWLLLLTFVLCGTSIVCPQALKPTSYNIVKEVLVEYEGVQTISPDAVLAHIKLKVDMEYDEVLVDKSIRSLYETGLYQFIQVKREAIPGGGSRLIFIILPKYRVNEIVFEGNNKIKTRKLKEMSDLEPGRSLDEVEVKKTADAVLDLYREKGYSDVTVDYHIERDPTMGTGTVVFRIDEGTKIKIKKINFVGNDHVKTGDLRGVMETKKRNWLSWITGSGRYKLEEFEDDLQKLRDYYNDQGFLDVEIPQSEVIFDYPSKTNLVITIHVKEGQEYRIGKVSISGNEKIFTTAELTAELTLESGDIFSPTEIDKNALALSDYYGKAGYLDTFVRAERLPNIETGNIDLNFVIKESSRYFVENINIQGNTKTKSIVILRELALAPGDVFDLVRMKSSEALLKNMRFFEEVTLAPEATTIAGRRNLRITVKEGRTGDISFGAGFSSIERAVIFAELKQGNFDLFNYRSMFQGDGQKFRLKIQLGSRSNNILLAFEEPWLFQRRLALGFEVFRSESSYHSNVYDELRTGFEIYLRKHLIEHLEGRLSYHLQEVKIFDIDERATSAIRSEQGTTLVSKLGFTLLRNTQNNPMTPTSGARHELRTEVAGGPVGGDIDYLRFEARSAKWWPTFKTGKQVFSLGGRMGTVTPFNDSRIPFFDRFFLGGSNDLRGFDFREVGPKDSSNEPIGGRSFGRFTTEYSVEIVNPVRFAVFYDAGFVNSGDFDFSMSDYNSDVGFGIRLEIMGAPLRVDIGFPMKTDAANDDGVQFNFGFSTPY